MTHGRSFANPASAACDRRRWSWFRWQRSSRFRLQSGPRPSGIRDTKRSVVVRLRSY